MTVKSEFVIFGRKLLVREPWGALTNDEKRRFNSKTIIFDNASLYIVTLIGSLFLPYIAAIVSDPSKQS